MISELLRIAIEMEKLADTAKHATADMLLTQALEAFEDDETRNLIIRILVAYSKVEKQYA